MNTIKKKKAFKGRTVGWMTFILIHATLSVPSSDVCTYVCVHMGTHICLYICNDIYVSLSHLRKKLYTLWYFTFKYFSPVLWRTSMWGWWDGWAGKDTCCKVWWPEFHPHYINAKNEYKISIVDGLIISIMSSKLIFFLPSLPLPFLSPSPPSSSPQDVGRCCLGGNSPIGLCVFIPSWSRLS